MRQTSSKKQKLGLVKSKGKPGGKGQLVLAPKVSTLDDIRKVMADAADAATAGDHDRAVALYTAVVEQKEYPRKALRAKKAIAKLFRSAADDIDDEDELEDLPDTVNETDDEIRSRLKRRFDSVERMVIGVINGMVPSIIVAGPGGLGKSHLVKKALRARKAEDPNFKYDYISGTVTPVGLFTSAWEHRQKGQVIVLDDADSVFGDYDALNILKAMLDSDEKRMISWRSAGAKWMKDLDIEPTFEFEGSVLFLSNIDFQRKIEKSQTKGAHFEALVDRSLYVHLDIRSISDFMVRIKMVVEEGMLTAYGLTPAQQKELMDFVSNNRKRFRHLSLRLIHQTVKLMLADPVHWKDDVEISKMFS